MYVHNILLSVRGSTCGTSVKLEYVIERGLNRLYCLLSGNKIAQTTCTDSRSSLCQMLVYLEIEIARNTTVIKSVVFKKNSCTLRSMMGASAGTALAQVGSGPFVAFLDDWSTATIVGGDANDIANIADAEKTLLSSHSDGPWHVGFARNLIRDNVYSDLIFWTEPARLCGSK